ncbi:MAG: trypsin-like peptidase domain-containing protein [Fuerstiella sp.]|jgi:S1-C subfamily serine protease|nr:trypsin-like peptidase domain-containing protein [Fuerstiella sp.]
MRDPEDHSRPQSTEPVSTNLLLVGALVVLSTLLVYQAVTSRTAAVPSGNYKPRTVTPRGELGADEGADIDVFRRASRSVVSVKTKGVQRNFYGGGTEREIASGSGIVWDASGYIVTNFHVVQRSLQAGTNTTLEVQFPDDIVVEAEVVGGVFEHDLAVLKVVPSDVELHPILVGTSSDLEVGQKALAIGNPFGLSQTLSTGVIGGLNRTVNSADSGQYLTGLIQTDAAINPGNSGGPLLDSSGRLIGVNTAIISPTGSYAGIGFSVPVDTVVVSVNRVLDEASGKQTPDKLGASVFSREGMLAQGYASELLDRGRIVSGVIPNSAAADAGLQRGDLITDINGGRLTSVSQLHDAVQSHEPGDVIELAILRPNRTGVVSITLSVTLRAPKVFF